MVLAHVEFDATDESGNLLSNVQARVEIEGGGLVSIYSDRAGSSALANPETFADGKINFYVAGGAYKITLTSGAFSRVLRYKPNGLLMEKDALTAAAVSFTPPTGMAATTVQAAIEEVFADTREKLAANRTYYVRTDGSDSNNGLANTAGGAFLTISKAIAVVSALDLSIYNVTIQVGAGTYANVSVTGAFVGTGVVTIVGDTVTPANVVIPSVSVEGSGSKLRVSGIRTLGLTALNGGYLKIVGNVTFYTSGSSICMTANGAGSMIDAVSATGIVVEAGTYGRFAYAIIQGYIQIFAASVTFSGTPAWSVACADGQRLGFINAGTATLSGAATGVRYTATLNGVIYTQGGGASFFPGGTGGSTATGGQYA